MGLALDEPDKNADETFEKDGLPIVIEKSLVGLLRRTQGVFMDWMEGSPPGYLVCLANRREVYSHSSGLDLVQLGRP